MSDCGHVLLPWPRLRRLMRFWPSWRTPLKRYRVRCRGPSTDTRFTFFRIPRRPPLRRLGEVGCDLSRLNPWSLGSLRHVYPLRSRSRHTPPKTVCVVGRMVIPLYPSTVLAIRKRRSCMFPIPPQRRWMIRIFFIHRLQALRHVETATICCTAKPSRQSTECLQVKRLRYERKDGKVDYALRRFRQAETALATRVA